MNNWKPTKLKQITTKVGSGATPRGGKNSYLEDGITLIRSLNVYDFYFEYNGLAFIDEKQAASLSNVEVQSRDILLNITGASVARCCIVPDTVLPARVNQHVAIVRINRDYAEPFFVFYTLNSPAYKQHLLTLAQGGATREALTKSTIENFEILLPPFQTQRRIAAILSAYDDLIENNSKRIKLLEQAAHDLYREWFVEFRFPGHDNVRMVDSGTEYGEIPEGWEVGVFTDIAEVLSGGTPKTNVPEYWNGDIPFFSPKDTGSSFYVLDTEKSITEAGLAKCSSKLYPKDTVFITARGTVGKVRMPACDMAMNQSCYALVGQSDIPQFFIFQLIQDRVEYLKQQAHGAVFDTIIINTFQRLEIVIPPLEIVKDYVERIKPIFDHILNLLKRNHALRETRDLLLPRLVSGEVDVSELEIKMEIIDESN